MDERTLVNELAALVAEWRQWPAGGTHQQCADELESILHSDIPKIRYGKPTKAEVERNYRASQRAALGGR